LKEYKMIDILIVDDDDSHNEYLKIILERGGYSVKVYTSAEEVLSFFKKDMFSILILDLGLIGMHGVDLCVEIRKIDTDVIIYALTGYDEVFDEISPQVAGFNGAYGKSNLVGLLDQVDIILKSNDKN